MTPIYQPLIKVANAPCSWGVLEFDMDRLGAPYPRVLKEMQETGYAGTELGDWGFLPKDPVGLSDVLSERNLELVGGFIPLPWSVPQLCELAWEQVRRTAVLMRDAGFPEALVILADANGTNIDRTRRAGRAHPEDAWPEEKWKTIHPLMDTFAKRVREETGLKTAFHHHAAGFVETPEEIDRLLEATNPKYLGLVLDTGHYCFGGGDPVEALERYGDRVWHVHFKDCHEETAEQARLEGWDYFESVARGVFCKLGEGQVNFPRIVEILRERRYEGWVVVEQDVLPGMGDPEACARDNRQYLRKLGL